MAYRNGRNSAYYCPLPFKFQSKVYDEWQETQEHDTQGVLGVNKSIVCLKWQHHYIRW